MTCSLQVVWNCSLHVTSPLNALKLQRYALCFLLLAAPDALDKVISHADIAANSYRTKHVDVSDQRQDASTVTTGSVDQIIVGFYQKLLSAILTHIKNTRKVEDTALLLLLGSVLGGCDVHLHKGLLRPALECLKSVLSAQSYTAVYCGVELHRAALLVGCTAGWSYTGQRCWWVALLGEITQSSATGGLQTTRSFNSISFLPK